jgi:hypothetical protein
MRAYETVLIVAAGIGLGAGVSLALMNIPAYDEILPFVESFVLGAAGIAIGLIIWYLQKKQSDKLDIQGDRIENQGKQMGNIVNQVNTQTTDMADMLAEVGTTNAQVQAMITEAKVREDKRKHYHLYHVREHTAASKERVMKAVEIIEDRYINKPRPSEEDEHRRTRDYIQNIIGQQKWMMEQITDHFREVKDLMNSPGLASRVVVDC